MNFTSSLEDVQSGFQPHRWADVDYTQVKFTGCSDTSGTNYDTGVDISEDIPLQPDDKYGTKKFTNRFNSSSSMGNGQWTGLASGNYYFGWTVWTMASITTRHST